MPIIVPRKNAVVTQPYHAIPPRSSSMSGRIVITASDSNATSVTTETRPMRNARRSPGGTGAADSVTSGTVGPRPHSRSRAMSTGWRTPEALTEPGGAGDRALDRRANAVFAADHDEVLLGSCDRGVEEL